MARKRKYKKLVVSFYLSPIHNKKGITKAFKALDKAGLKYLKSEATYMSPRELLQREILRVAEHGVNPTESMSWPF